MGWFKKKKKEDETKLPDLPGSSKLPKLPSQSEKKELPMLPSLKKPEATSMLPTPADTRAVEISDIREKPTMSFAPEKEPIFVKLDKFQTASENFEKVKEKVDEIEDTLKKIKEIKEKEDAELREWENEIQLIKSRISDIDVSLFKKL